MVQAATTRYFGLRAQGTGITSAIVNWHQHGATFFLAIIFVPAIQQINRYLRQVHLIQMQPFQFHRFIVMLISTLDQVDRRQKAIIKNQNFRPPGGFTHQALQKINQG
jgi:hypothetical protein